jgi:hypothetical protein
MSRDGEGVMTSGLSGLLVVVGELPRDLPSQPGPFPATSPEAWREGVGDGHDSCRSGGPAGRGRRAHPVPADEVRGGSGTVQLLPRGVAHGVRVPEEEARIIQVSVGPPYDGFARAMSALMLAGAPLDAIVEEAGRHGVRLG